MQQCKTALVSLHLRKSTWYHMKEEHIAIKHPFSGDELQIMFSENM